MKKVGPTNFMDGAERQEGRGEGPNLGATAGHRSLASEGRRRRSRLESLLAFVFSSDEEVW
jgi:hypothetical protein